jgi:hypothetical protein
VKIWKAGIEFKELENVKLRCGGFESVAVKFAVTVFATYCPETHNKRKRNRAIIFYNYTIFNHIFL